MKFRFFLCWTWGVVLTLPGRAVEPPLPGEDAPPPPTDVFRPLLEPGDELPPGSEAPPLPEEPAVLPPEMYPDGLPGSDGVDDLPVPLEPAVRPVRPMRPVPARPELPVVPGWTPPGDLLPLPVLPQVELPPAPDLELAARAYWHKSPRQARDLSRKERKPLLMFFYQKWKSAPMAAMGGGVGDPNISLSDDLLATTEFKEFAGSRVVLTQLFYPIGSPNKTTYPPEKLAALQRFKDYFNVKGFPTLLLLDENGREIERVKGYARVKTGRGVDLSSAMPILERLKVAVARREAVIATEDERLRRLMAQNYREWTSHAGSKLLAKMVSSVAGEVILRDAAGAMRRVLLEQLSIVDQAWIHRQLKGTQQAAATERGE